MSPAGDFVTFVVRLSRMDDGRLAGVVERVKTGEKVRFHELEAVGSLIQRMLVDHDSIAQPSTDTTRRQ